MCEKDYFDAAAVIFAGMLKNDDIEIQFTQNPNHQLEIMFKTKGSKDFVNSGGIMSAITEVLKQLKLKFIRAFGLLFYFFKTNEDRPRWTVFLTNIYKSSTRNLYSSQIYSLFFFQSHYIS
ncbi:hypothetical protein GQ588_14025 [Dehalobacter restrictus]|uniref:Uncharacterized protein n=1 Tax=Dehalobacter restrictus TaxID=55583 RepID=A0A857DMS6_9FIRM|nr:hypothetical protein GQ588_14025 [Dehalobacter restrictus]